MSLYKSDNVELVPFGKYKGQPVEVLANDKGYCDWLMTQGDFMDRFPQVKTLIVNNFKEPEDTPDHNRLQGLFLDECFCLKFAAKFIDEEKERELFNEYLEDFQKVKESAAEYIEERERTKDDDWRQMYSYICNLEPYDYIEPYIDGLRFETDGIDVKFTYRLRNDDISHKMPNGIVINRDSIERNNRVYYTNSSDIYIIWFKIEIKPSVGDDFPSIMRQMKSNECNTLFYSEYNGVGVSEDQMRKMMKIEQIRTIRLDEIED
jgi:hypothetical protein